ncbi:unnamed protein product [Rotaria sp. Silwood1]|nr:unnamed protein product [Rotaria sp. Silwood1]CAF0854561.1 unnamed protein product [Rotaria sp. Silwood1]CAF3383448.1 unnamed protein product [Rotaria sp. Silwood1]CAF4518603.1 unnamed protein product [Rotaria sp. Silwood1]CAF4587667.1 unnamed protein product [Rotaria sp. Silwood1]
MACYLPDHLVRCLICKNLFSDARRLRCGCVYCYLCCLQLIKNNTLYCYCSYTHRFNSQDEIEKSLVIDNVVNDLVRQQIKQKQASSKKLVDYDSISISSPQTEDDINPNDQQTALSISSSSLPLTTRKQVAVAQPPCTICKRKSNMIILCEHCNSDICELCMEKHYQIIIDILHDKWIQCKKKFDQINEHVFLSHHNKMTAISKLDDIRKTIEERSKNLKSTIDNHRQTLAKHIDNHIQSLEQIIKTNDVNNEYESIKERLPKILEEETNTSNLLSYLEETEKLLQQLITRNKQLKEIEMKIPYLSQPDPTSINLSHLIGELKFDEQSTQTSSTTTSTANHNHQINSNDNNLLSLMSITTERTRFPRRVRPSIRSRGGRGIQHSSHVVGFYPRNNYNPRNGRYNGNYRGRGRVSARPRPPLLQSTEDNLDIVPNYKYQWSIDFKEIPCFLAVLDNRNRARHSDTRPHHRHDYMLFIADDYGQISVYSLPKSMSKIKPSIIGTGELFPKNSRLLLESFTVYEFAIVVYVRRFEQKSNEIEHSKLIKAGLPIMKGEQGRYNDHGGMIYLFSHGGDEIDGIYQSHPIRTILADQTFGRLWALNPMQNNVYCYMAPNNKNEIHKYLQDEEIVLDFSDEQFEPSIMIQSNQSIGLIDAEHDSYRLYAKDNKFSLITTYENLHNPEWKLTDGVIFKDNRTLLKLTEDKCYDNNSHETNNGRNKFHNTPRRCLIELTPDGQEKRLIQAETLYSMVLGPDDEVILGFAMRGDRGLIHCY